MAENFTRQKGQQISRAKTINNKALKTKRNVSYINRQSKLSDIERLKQNYCLHDQQCIFNNNQFYYVRNNPQQYRIIHL